MQLKKCLFSIALMLALTDAGAQQIKEKDLLGIWDKIDQKEKVITLQFLDSMNLDIINQAGNTSRATYKLTQETTHQKISIDVKTEAEQSMQEYILTLDPGKSLTLIPLGQQDSAKKLLGVDKALIFKKRKPLF